MSDPVSDGAGPTLGTADGTYLGGRQVLASGGSDMAEACGSRTHLPPLSGRARWF